MFFTSVLSFDETITIFQHISLLNIYLNFISNQPLIPYLLPSLQLPELRTFSHMVAVDDEDEKRGGRSRVPQMDPDKFELTLTRFASKIT